MTCTIDKEPARYQAVCGDCAWHTPWLRNANQAAHFGDQHEAVCPNPPPPRNGALAECGCWCYASPGSEAGRTRDKCPIHGDVLLVKMNMPEPKGEKHGHLWTEGEDR